MIYDLPTTEFVSVYVSVNDKVLSAMYLRVIAV